MKQLESETVMRVNCENKIKTLEEQLEFNMKVHKQVGLPVYACAMGFAQTVCK